MGWSEPEIVIPGRCGLRLSLDSADPTPTADQTAKTTVYLTPYENDQLTIYNPTTGKWVEYDTAGAALSKSLSGLAANTNYDVFVRKGPSSLILDTITWLSDTARVSNLVRQNGVYCRNTGADLGRLYLGTIRTTGTTGQCEDSKEKRFVWNARHRIRRKVTIYDATASWNYATSTWRAARASTANRIQVVNGLTDRGGVIDLSLAVIVFSSSSQTNYFDIGYDSTSTPDNLNGRGNSVYNVAGEIQTGHLRYNREIGLGYHYLQWMEFGGGSGTVTWYGGTDQGMIGTWEC